MYTSDVEQSCRCHATNHHIVLILAQIASLAELRTIEARIRGQMHRLRK